MVPQLGVVVLREHPVPGYRTTEHGLALGAQEEVSQRAGARGGPQVVSSSTQDLLSMASGQRGGRLVGTVVNVARKAGAPRDGDILCEGAQLAS